MAKFEIQLAPGQKVEAEAPETATKEQIFGRLAEQFDANDLSTFRAQNTQFGEFLRQRALEPVEGESEEGRAIRLGGQITSPEVGTVEGVLRSGLQGLSFSGGDELVGNMRAAAKVAQGDERPFEEIRDEEIERQRQLLDAFDKQQGFVSGLSEFVGAFLPALVAGPGALTGSLGRQALKSAGIGAVFGAGHGFGAGEDTFENRLANALMTGAFGGAGGAVAPFIGRGVENLVAARPFLGRLADRVGLGPGTTQLANRAGVSREALDIASEAVGADDVARLSPNQMLGEAGDTATGMLDFLGQRPGPTQRIVRQAVEGRVDDATAQVNRVLDDVLGAPQGIRGTARDIAQATSQARDDAYTAAYNQVIDYASDAGQRIRGVLARIPDRIKNQAIQDANELAQLDGVNMPPIVGTGDDLSVMQLDYIKRALNEISEGTTNNFGQRTGLGVSVGNRARDLRDAMGDAVPDYLTALQLGSDNITRRDALELGANLLSRRTTREAVNEFVERASVGGDLPGDVVGAFERGVRQQIDDAMANVQRTATDDDTAAREAIKVIKDFSSRANREKLETVLGPARAGQLIDEMDEAARAFNLRATQAQNSKTAARAMIEDRITPQPGPLRELAAGSPRAAAARTVQSVTGETPQAQNQAADAVLTEVAELLTGPRGADAMDLAVVLQQAGLPRQQAAAVRNLVETFGRGTALGSARPATETFMANQ